MRLVKVAAGCLNQTPLDFKGNEERIVNAIFQAQAQNVDILCLPELCITGYGCEDAFFMPHVIESGIKTMYKIIEKVRLNTNENNNIIYSLGLPIYYCNSIYNCSVLINSKNSGILGIVPKQHLCSDGIHYESRWFKQWEPGKVVNLNVNPFGDLLFNIDGVKIGFEICEDAWVADRPGISLSQRYVDIILNPSASHFSFNKHKTRKRFVEEGSRAFKSVYVYANLLGNESGRVIFDGDTYIATDGNIVANGPRLSFKDSNLTTAVVDIDINRIRQFQCASFKSNIDTGSNINLNNVLNKTHKPNEISQNRSLFNEDCEYDTFEQVVALGLYDYMRKSYSNGFVVSLSGGADSAAVACLVRETALRLEKETNKKLDINNILTCVYQATSNSSINTENAAEKLANAIGANYHSIYINNIVNDYKHYAEKIIGRKITWENDDIALQNIQARVRAPSVWMVANIQNALLLSTSNRSEAAVGYATMDGDTCGGLSPIAGVSKEFILRWIKHYSNKFNAINEIVKLKPSAELRPGSENQTDEDDLMPYDILNKIEVMAIRDKMSPDDIVTILDSENINYSQEYVDKFFKLFCKNQWKRERYAPSFHLDDESLDPKTFCRFPILSAGL